LRMDWQTQHAAEAIHNSLALGAAWCLP
jgi:hypothetical protein